MNHIDGSRDNNIPSNLEWMSRRENALHSRDTLGRMRHLAHQKVSHADIPLIRERAAAGENHFRISKDFGVSSATIRQIVLRKTYSYVD